MANKETDKETNKEPKKEPKKVMSEKSKKALAEYREAVKAGTIQPKTKAERIKELKDNLQKVEATAKKLRDKIAKYERQLNKRTYDNAKALIDSMTPQEIARFIASCNK